MCLKTDNIFETIFLVLLICNIPKSKFHFLPAFLGGTFVCVQKDFIRLIWHSQDHQVLMGFVLFCGKDFLKKFIHFMIDFKEASTFRHIQLCLKLLNYLHVIFKKSIKVMVKLTSNDSVRIKYPLQYLLENWTPFHLYFSCTQPY